MKRIVYIVLLLCGMVTGAWAETKWDHINQRNEIRIGWGDQLFESLIWHNPTSIVKTMPADYRQVYHENYHHDQHLWLEYQWRQYHWLSFGGMFDMSEVHWDDVTRDGAGVEVGRDPGHYFYNIVFMPTVRFTYFHHDYVNLYSGIGVGMGINSGTETNGYGQTTDVGAAINVTVLGVSANYKNWFCFFDLGGLYSLKNGNTLFMVSSRIMNFGLGVRF